ncbi:MAG: O-antigen polymerase, partial [Deferribacteraceae bacterium]|nr:O-antigen polymerase [Deferribacteraceae bacterium]
IPVVMKEINKKILKPISLTPETMEYIEKSDWLLRNYKDPEAIKKFNRLVFHSSINIDVNNDNLPDTWHMWKPKGSEMKSKITDQGTLRFENSGLNRGGIITRRFTLQPEKKYILEIKLKAELNNQKAFDIYIFSTKGTTTQLKVQSLALENIYKMYTFDFITTKDLDNSQQYVRLDHKDKEAGYIEISEINIYLQE